MGIGISPATMIEPHKSKSLLASKKAIGQMQKVLSMIEEDRYCIAILNQVKAVEGLLSAISTSILQSHLETCATKALTSNSKSERDKMIAELVKAFKAAKK